MISKSQLMSKSFILYESCLWIEANKDELLELMLEKRDHNVWCVPEHVIKSIKRFKAINMCDRIANYRNYKKNLDVVGYSLLYGTEFIESYDWQLHRLFCMHYDFDFVDDSTEQIEEYITDFLECSWEMGDDFYYIW